jgi:hypothetical protein
MTEACKQAGLRLKLDLRLLVLRDEEYIDAMTGEFAHKPLKRKLYLDKLKSVLATKCHLNAFIKSMPYLPQTSIKDVIVPIIQIMGFNAHIYTLHLADKGLYVLEEVYVMNFPYTHQQLQKNLASLIDGLALIQVNLYIVLLDLQLI